MNITKSSIAKAIAPAIISAFTLSATPTGKTQAAEFPIRPFPATVTPPLLAPPLRANFHGTSYIESTANILETLPRVDLEGVNCNDGSAQFTSFRKITQPYVNTQGDTVDVDMAKIQSFELSRADMMAEFMLTSISLREFKKEVIVPSSATITGQEVVNMFMDASPQNHLKIIALSKIIHASDEFGKKCNTHEGHPFTNTQAQENPDDNNRKIDRASLTLG